jgi:hypothetical protein
MEFGSSYKYTGRTPSNTSQLSSAELQKGDTGSAAPNVQIEYSDDNVTFYGTPGAVAGDITHIRFSNDDGDTWDVVELVTGPEGAPGDDADNVVIQYGVATYGDDLLDGEGKFASSGSWSEGRGWLIENGVAQVTNYTPPSGSDLKHNLESSVADGTSLKLEFDITQSDDNIIYFIIRLQNSTTLAYKNLYYWDDGGEVPTGYHELSVVSDGEYDQILISCSGNSGTQVSLDNITLKTMGLTYSDEPTGDVEYMRVSIDGGDNFTDPFKVGWKINTVKIQFKDSTDIGDTYEDTYASGDDVMRISKDGGVNWIEDIQILGDDGSDGADGDSAYVYIAYASDDSGTGWTEEFNPDLDYIAIRTTSTEIATRQLSDFAGLWKNYKGEEGQSQYVFIGYATDSSGSNATTNPDAGTQYQYVSFLVKDTNETPDTSEFSDWHRFYGFMSDNFLTPIDGHDGGDASVNPATIGDTSYTNGGGGLDDMTVGEVFTGSSDINYVVEIDGTGTPDTFKWSKDGGTSWETTTVNITGSAQTLEEGVQITFGATTGHAVGDKWEWTAEAPDNGDRYILEDVSTQGTTYHSSFGTINKDMGDVATSLGDNDIVEYVSADGEFKIAFDSSASDSDRSVNILEDKNDETNRLWTFFHDTDTWEDMGEAYLHDNLPDIAPLGVPGAKNHLTDTQLNALTQNNGDLDSANNFHYHKSAYNETFTSADQDANNRVTLTHNLSASEVWIMVYVSGGNMVQPHNYTVINKNTNSKYIEFPGDIPGTYSITAMKPIIDGS